MSTKLPLLSTYNYNLDAKNRIFVPAKHREILGTDFIIFPNIKDERSLIISSVEYFNSVIEEISNNEQLTVEERSDAIEYISSNGDTVSPDAQGRVVLSSTLVALAHLGGSTMIVGCNSHAKMWSAEVYQQISKNRAKELAEKFKKTMVG